MSSNNLLLNDDKTNLIVMSNKTRKDERKEVFIKAGNYVIKPSFSHKLLGAQICETMKWKEHIITHENSLLKQLNSRINGLCLIPKQASFKTRLMVANGIYLSKLTNLIQVWGGTQDFIVKALQVSQNKVCKIVTGLSWFTPTATLLRQCGWLSIRQLIVYHTILSVHRTVISREPKYAYDKLCTETAQNTRQVVKFSDNFCCKSERGKLSYFYRGAMDYNQIPSDLKQMRNIQSFKMNLKRWIRSNIPVV